jgi:hypothetical protein
MVPAALIWLRMDSPTCTLVDNDLGAKTSLARDLEHQCARDYGLFPAPNAATGLQILERLGAVGPAGRAHGHGTVHAAHRLVTGISVSLGA